MLFLQNLKYLAVYYDGYRKINHITNVGGIIQPPGITRKWRCSFMFEYDYTKEYGLPMDESLKQMRIRKHPMQLGGDMVVIDQLEKFGTIRIYENTGETLYMPADMEACGMECNKEVVQAAEMRVTVFPDEKKVQVDRIYCEYGYNDELVPALLEQAMNFAGFYNYRLSILDLRKKHKRQERPAFSRGRFLADSMLGY